QGPGLPEGRKWEARFSHGKRIAKVACQTHWPPWQPWLRTAAGSCGSAPRDGRLARKGRSGPRALGSRCKHFSADCPRPKAAAYRIPGGGLKSLEGVIARHFW